MKWLTVAGVTVLGLTAACLAIRAASDLPSLEGRTRSAAFTDTADSRLGRAIEPLAAAHPGLSGVHALADGREAFAARVLLARSAERSIDAQYYMWRNDLTGTLLLNELRAAADRGVRVRLLLDDNTTAGLDDTLAALDAHPNVEIRLFNPFVIRSPRFVGYLTDFRRLNRRMHNKSFTIDNQATIVGGRNVGDEYFEAGDGAVFVDLDLLAVGPVVRDVSGDFDRYWASASAFPAERILAPVGGDGLGEIEARAAAVEGTAAAQVYVAAVRALPIVRQLGEGTLPLDWAPVRLVSDDPAKGLGRAGDGELLITRLGQLLESPSSNLGLVSGYFVPTAAGVDILGDLARRGLRINVVTNALEATDVPVVHAGYAPYRRPLLEAGVRLWELRGPRGGRPVRRDIGGSGSSGSAPRGSATALHAKTFAVDGELVFVGSFNFDPRSARLNTELGLVVMSPDLARRMDEALARIVPERAYEVRLSGEGKLVWIERVAGREIRHDVEPGTGRLQRAAIWMISRLPIEWLL